MCIRDSSTGVPKGVCCHHQGALNTLLALNERYAVGRADRVLALSSLSFDLSVYDVFGLLSAGASVVVPPSEISLIMRSREAPAIEGKEDVRRR